MEYELSIETNDGWVVTVVSDKPISVSDATIRTIIVQPKEDHAARIAKGTNAKRTVYLIGTKGGRIIEGDGTQLVEVSSSAPKKSEGMV